MDTIKGITTFGSIILSNLCRYLFLSINILAIDLSYAVESIDNEVNSYINESIAIKGQSIVRSDNNMPTFVGRKICANCHQKQSADWKDSHHDLAMQEANEVTVLGNFHNKKYKYNDITTRFYKKNNKFYVNTEGLDGKLKDYEIKYTFGVAPLQQYLIEFPDGRLQALSIVWDARAEEKGGQRWMHLYPDEKIDHKDPLHWTGVYQNWNVMCSECHSTNVVKNYSQESNTYNTLWSEIDVSCEACHGAGSKHIVWARQDSNEKKRDPGKGLLISLDERKNVTWTINKDTGNARRSIAKKSNVEVEMCARCHSRRSVISENYVHGKPLLDTHIPSVLSQGLYHVDGQILDEVYVYGSFLQSKMHAEGVTCSDCHDPHALKTKTDGEGVCYKCHLASKYTSTDHHRHKVSSTGSNCLECHMPSKTFMVIDERRDHSIRIPRPDLTMKLGVPNACNNCHIDRSAHWASEAIQKWYGAIKEGYQKFAHALYEARQGGEGVDRQLIEILKDRSVPDIVRATAIDELQAYLSPALLDVVRSALQDEDPLVRVEALNILDAVPHQLRLTLAFDLLSDPVRAVRITAARILAPVPEDQLEENQIHVIKKVINEYISSQMLNSDRPENNVNLGLLYTQLGQLDEAERYYRHAIKLQSGYTPAYINLADLYRRQKKDNQIEPILREGIKHASDKAALNHSLGLLYVRQKQLGKSLGYFKRAVELNANNPRFVYVYAVALNSAGKNTEAISLLEGAHARHRNDTDILFSLILFNRDKGNQQDALRYAKIYLELLPHDGKIKSIVRELSRSH